MINRSLQIKKLLKIILEMYFYAIAYFLVFTLTGYEAFSMKGVVKLILFIPIQIGSYYGGSMVMMFFFIPIINKAVERFSKKNIAFCCCCCFFTLLYFHR